MATESVAYHRRTVLETGDDYPGMALVYYASRGEALMRWSGAGAETLDLNGIVSPLQVHTGVLVELAARIAPVATGSEDPWDRDRRRA